MPEPTNRNPLTPDDLRLVETIARSGSMAAAARELGMVPSALTYRVRRLEEALDVLLFDRSARRATPTRAGQELIDSGQRLLDELAALAQRVRRVATGWESALTIAADAIVARATLLELCEDFYALGVPTRLRLRTEILSGTWQSLLDGQADLAIGVVTEATQTNLMSENLGEIRFVFAVAPHHPLAAREGVLCDEDIRQHRAVAVADSAPRGEGASYRLLPGQPVLTVSTMQFKLEAQLRGLGCGFLPEPVARPYLDAGRLVAVPIERQQLPVRACYAWRRSVGAAPSHPALDWWLGRLRSPVTRAALLSRHFVE